MYACFHMFGLTCLRMFGMARFRMFSTACLLLTCSILVSPAIHAQEAKPPKKLRVLPKGMQFAVVEGNDTIPVIFLKEVLVFPPLKFKNEKERREYDKLVRDVKRTLPYAKLVYNTLIETYEYIETLPNDKTKDAHLKRMEKELFKEYKPELKKLTLTQGKLLLKLIDRECNQSSYQLVNAVLGKFRASFWNLFANMLGASMKTDYDPKGKDAMTERVVQLVERGMI